MKFRKKPVVIEAMQFTEQCNRRELVRFIACDFLVENGHIVIRTLEGDMRADLDDWIIKGVKGEFYPCKPDIFAATYEPVDDARHALVTEPTPPPREPTTPG